MIDNTSTPRPDSYSSGAMTQNTREWEARFNETFGEIDVVQQDWDTIKVFIHQQLQKAREEEKEVIKSIIRVARDSAEVDRIASQRLRDLLDHSELDQDKV